MTWRQDSAYVAGPDVIQQELTCPITDIQELSSLREESVPSQTDGELLQVLLSHGIPASLHLPSPSSSFHVYKNEWTTEEPPVLVVAEISPYAIRSISSSSSSPSPSSSGEAAVAAAAASNHSASITVEETSR